MRAIRIAVVDDHPVFREGVISVLRSEEGFDLVGEGRCSDDAVRLASEMRPDVMLLDVSMPGGGINALKAITDTSQATRIIVLTVSENGEDVLKAFEAGATGYLLKGVHRSELIDAVRMARNGDMTIDPSLAFRIIGGLSKAEAAGGCSVSPQALDQLTPREQQVLDFVSQGLTNKEIALKLALTPRTVKNYMTSIMMKLRVRNRVEAALCRKQVSP